MGSTKEMHRFRKHGFGGSKEPPKPIHGSHRRRMGIVVSMDQRDEDSGIEERQLSRGDQRSGL